MGFLVGVYSYSSITILCYCLMLNIFVRLAHHNGTHLLAEMKLMPRRTIPAAPEQFITEEQVAAHVAVITRHINTSLGAAYELLCGECTPVVLKSLVGLFLLSVA